MFQIPPQMRLLQPDFADHRPRSGSLAMQDSIGDKPIHLDCKSNPLGKQVDFDIKRVGGDSVAIVVAYGISGYGIAFWADGASNLRMSTRREWRRL
jgi:hypothetical protein